MYGGIVELEDGIHRCYNYRTLTSVCVVVEPTEDLSSWKPARREDGHIIGCEKSLFLGKYETVKDVKEVPPISEQITVTIRSIDDPAVQVILLTDDAYNVGLDPAAQLIIGILGLVFSTLCLCSVLLKFRKLSQE